MYSPSRDIHAKLCRDGDWRIVCTSCGRFMLIPAQAEASLKPGQAIEPEEKHGELDWNTNNLVIETCNIARATLYK